MSTKTNAALERANQLYESERYEEAARAYEEATGEIEPWNAFAWRGLGLTLSHLGRHEDAITACQKAEELMFGNPEIHYAAGYVLVQAKRYSEGIAELDRVLTIYPEHAEAWHTLIYALLQEAKTAKPERAALLLERAYRAEPTNPHIVAPYLEALFQANLKGKAAQVWVKMSNWLANHELVAPIVSKMYADPAFRAVIERFEEQFGTKLSKPPLAIKPQAYASADSRPCPKCGYYVPFGEAYCPQCGYDVRVGARALN
jgi:tetratricopeptide (TPR) repeat protein